MITLLALGFLAMNWTVSASAGQKIRMYEINKKQQQRKIVVGGAVEEPGCHNLLWGKELYRLAQIGFSWCSIYAEDECAADSIVPAYWGDGDYKRYNIKEGQLQEKLYPGTKWMIESGGRAIQSWYCEAK